MRIKLTLQYDGTHFCGFQIQPGLRTVQAELENAVFMLTGTKTGIVASGRTDAGVHALGQVAHFDTEKDLGDKFVGGLNFYLPSDVRVIKAECVGDDFHARFSAKNKTYIYLMYEAKIDNPVLRFRAVRVEKANIDAMNAAARDFVGKHDFAAFMSTGSDTKTTERTVTRAEVFERDGLIVFKVSADGFLYNMVRKMVAALLEVSAGKRNSVKDLLTAGATFTRVAPPYGLYLSEVNYL